MISVCMCMQSVCGESVYVYAECAWLVCAHVCVVSECICMQSMCGECVHVHVAYVW